jgi:sucrose-6-phosphate hydrolase SacC (GH32 family)
MFGVNRDNSSLADFVTNMTQVGTFNHDLDTITVQIFLDHSVIEIYVNNGYNVLTTRVYPVSPPEYQTIEIFSEGTEKVTFDSINVWALDSIWSEDN